MSNLLKNSSYYLWQEILTPLQRKHENDALSKVI